MRHLLILIALVALVWSGLHAGPAEAHENDLGHSSASAAVSHTHGEESPSDRGTEQHVCHHHCPNAPAAHAPEATERRFFAEQLVFGVIAPALHPTKTAPPLDPPIS